jgi:hypothetical protein
MKTTADSAMAAMPTEMSRMAAMELGESSDAEWLAIGVTTNSPTAREITPRIAPATARREVNGCRAHLPEILIPAGYGPQSHRT